MFQRLLPRCRAALPAVAAAFTVPVVAHERTTTAAPKPLPRRAVACESVGAVVRTPAIQALAAGDADAFHREYELGDELGRGTFGIVQRARHRPTGGLRAVKRVRRASGGSAALEEAQVLASLDHPNVVGFHECFRTEHEVVLVQELCEGVPLEAKLGSVLGAGLGTEETATALQQMLVAVRYCHARGFVHRDLKADNFVFDSAAPSAMLKLIDFGLAGRCSPGERLPGRAGTVDYSSPEALREGEGFGQPADVWALGAIFFLLITGEPLIKVDQPAQTPSEELRRALEGQAMRRVLDATYIRNRLAAVSSRLPAEAVDLLEDMLRSDPQRRITAEQALRHPFVRENVPTLPQIAVQ